MRKAIFLPLMFVLLSCGRSEIVGDALKKANETQAMAMLKQYQVAQSIYRVEGWGPEFGYARFRDLYEESGGGQFLDERTYKAWDGHTYSAPVSGYLIADIDTDRSRRAGACAYPLEPGRSGDLMILMLLDDSDPDEWSYYVAPAEEIGDPIRTWPGAATLGKFRRLEKFSPQEGLDRARDLFDEATSQE